LRCTDYVAHFAHACRSRAVGLRAYHRRLPVTAPCHRVCSLRWLPARVTLRFTHYPLRRAFCTRLRYTFPVCCLRVTVCFCRGCLRRLRSAVRAFVLVYCTFDLFAPHTARITRLHHRTLIPVDSPDGCSRLPRGSVPHCLRFARCWLLRTADLRCRSSPFNTFPTYTVLHVWLRTRSGYAVHARARLPRVGFYSVCGYRTLILRMPHYPGLFTRLFDPARAFAHAFV